MIRKHDLVLFQGDSITDCGRDRERTEANIPESMGAGYAGQAASRIAAQRPNDDLKFHNRGIGGNRVCHLVERWQADCLDLKPDVLSILIGVNDAASIVRGDYGGGVDKYDRDYRDLLQRTRDALPDVRLILCEPFVLCCGNVDDTWLPTLNEVRAVARKHAEAFGAIFVPFQEVLNEALEQAPPLAWTSDGVHPTIAGHDRLARAWIQAADQ